MQDEDEEAQEQENRNLKEISQRILFLYRIGHDIDKISKITRLDEELVENVVQSYYGGGAG